MEVSNSDLVKFNLLINNFNFNIYQFYLKFNEEVSFDWKFFFSLRGALGYHLKKHFCINKTFNCKGCVFSNVCAYKYIFETAPPENSKLMKKFTSIPHPFLFNGFEKIDEKRIKFNIVLIGKGNNFLPYIIFAIESAGTHPGIGKKGLKFQIEKVMYYPKFRNYFNNSPSVIYNKGKLKKLPSNLKVEDLKPFIPDNLDNITIEFITPARIKYKNKFIKTPEFHIFIRALLMRIKALLYFHCRIDMKDIKIYNIVSIAEKVKIKGKEIKWNDTSRFSTRQKSRLKLGGFTGKVNYEGNITPFLKIIYTGLFINIGKQSSFGLGEYRIV